MNFGIGTTVGVNVVVGKGVGVFVAVEVGIAVFVGVGRGVVEKLQAERKNITKIEEKNLFKTNLQFVFRILFCTDAPNGLRYLRWGGDGEAVRLEK
jgi:hypothetical protein